MSRLHEAMPNAADFEALMIGNAKLQEIEAYQNRFNPIKVMGMERMEIRHSAILGWLLDPQENHGLGDRFLKEFLAKSLQGAETKAGISALDIISADLHRAEVRREWRSIDLLIIAPDQNWVFIIENKFHSKQHSDQLRRYYRAVASAFPLFQNLLDPGYKPKKHARRNTLWTAQGVFLTLHDEEPALPEIYAPMRYQDALLSLELLLKTEAGALQPKVFNFITHYLNILRETLDMSKDLDHLKTIARDLYRENRKAFDFIFEHGKSSDFKTACDATFPQGTADLSDWIFDQIGKYSYVYHHSNAVQCTFLPQSWYEALGKDKFWWHGCEKWGASFPVICWFQLLSSTGDGKLAKLRLYAQVGPLIEHEFRKELIKAIQDADAKGLVAFQKGATSDTARYSLFLKAKESSKEIKDENDAEEIQAAMVGLIKKFESLFEDISKQLGEFIKYGKPDALES